MPLRPVFRIILLVLPILAGALLWWWVQRGDSQTSQPPLPPKPPAFIMAWVAPHEVRVKDYFKLMDTLVQRLDTLVAYALDETLLLRANPWLMDTLMSTDYDRRKARGEFVYDQRQLVVLRPGDTLWVPGDTLAAELRKTIRNTWIDINIPEFRLRIVAGEQDTLFSLPVRVGQNRKRFLEAIGREENLRTRTGVGEIIRVNRYPVWSNPVTGKSYKDTQRDDGLRTKLPQIPWLEPAINGIRYGQMIHPTTNPETLGKAYSNGCIGTSEADAWRLYFYAPLGTKVVIRYDRRQILPSGDTVWLRDVYDQRRFKRN